jgi:hypothetical protein
MSDQVRAEAANIIAPLMNNTTTVRKRIAAVAITSTSARFDLSTYLTSFGAGHYLSFTAIGADVYVAFNNADSGTVDPTVTTSGAATVCYPLKDGVEKHLRMVENFSWLVARTSSGSATLYIAVASLGPSQGSADI